ncbi:helix-turn-helix transcriptional regulator [Treponema sp.]|uniref:helix-turn-helix transcriptional regulator n=1 Tax=Treponema sp. TaxID=166 RepID=UPI00388DC77F
MEKKDKAWKLRKIVEYIRTMDHPNSEALRNRFRIEEKVNISAVTIYRYINYLKDVEKAPIKADMNRLGSGYYLEDPNFWSDKVTLSPGELVGLGLLQSLMKVYKNTPVEKDLGSLFEKIRKYLPDGARYDESRIAQYIRVINDPMAVIDTTIFTSLIESVQEHKAISFNYMKNGALEPKKYCLHPYRILFHQTGDWYVHGCLADQTSQFRTFAFSRMTDIQNTGERFTIPVDYKLEKHLDPEVGVWHSDSYYTVKLLFHKDIAQHARERKWHHTERKTQNEDGSILVQFTTSQIYDLRRIVMGYGSKVTVLEPQELIEDIRKELSKMNLFYGVH